MRSQRSSSMPGSGRWAIGIAMSPAKPQLGGAASASASVHHRLASAISSSAGEGDQFRLRRGGPQHLSMRPLAVVRSRALAAGRIVGGGAVVLSPASPIVRVASVAGPIAEVVLEAIRIVKSAARKL